MKIRELHLQSSNLVQTEEFYTRVLNIPIYTKTASELSFAFGETTLFFSKSDTDNRYHIAFDIPNNQLEEAYTWLKSRTPILPVTENNPFSDFESWNAKSFYFYDNNSNLLEFIVRYDLKNASENSFSSSSILYASEIGIVTNNVPLLTETLLKKYPLSIYPKQPPQENFAAIGNETGLFILVNPERNWYPTDQKATLVPLKIIFNTESSKNLEFILP